MIGQVLLGRYEVVKPLGEGGMGRVFLARDQSNGREVVLKLVHSNLVSEAKIRDLFLREMEFMSRFRHPHAVEFYEAAVDGPQGPCIVMEYIPGKALDILLKEHGRYDALRAGKWLGQIGSALAYGHAMSLIHRDLKPSNVMVANPDTAEEKIKIMDFGLSRFASVPQLDLEELRGRGKRVAGTPEYLSPEQARGDDIDLRSDLYAIGLILYELLGGRKPFIERTAKDYMRAHAYDYPPSFAKIGVFDVPPPVEAVVQRCLYKYPAERPLNAEELVQLYERALGEQISVAVDVALPSDGPSTPGTSAALQQHPPDAIVFTLEGWMPEKIAVVKLQGFLQSVEGKVLESRPGLVRVRLRMSQSELPKPKKSGFFAALLGGSRDDPPPPKYVFMDFYMEKRDPSQAARLTCTLVLRAENADLNLSPEGVAFCEKICGDICAYLLAKRVETSGTR